MTHPYTKLAEELDITTRWMCSGLAATPKDVSNVREAARILRAAAAVDVAGLMAMVKEHALNCYELGAIKSDVKNHAQQRMKVAGFYAALESALRMALAGREGFVLVPVEPTPEMVDAARSLTSWPDGVYRAMLAAAPKGTP